MADPTPVKPKREADRSEWVLWAGVALLVIGFMFETDVKYDDAPTINVYSVSLGATCEQDVKTCRMKANPAIGFRPETTRNEVVEFDRVHKEVHPPRLYTGCVIWSATDWWCEGGRIVMSEGLIARNDLQLDPDIYYVPKIAWKMAKLHILPVDSVRHAKVEPPKRKQGA